MAQARKILTLNAISKRGLARLPETYTVSNDLVNPDAILVRSQVMHDMPISDSVLAIGRDETLPAGAHLDMNVAAVADPSTARSCVRPPRAAASRSATRSARRSSPASR